MYGVTFGTKHSYSDYGMILTDYEIGEPVPRRYLVTVPGRNGVLDLTEEMTPKIKYENRPLRFAFTWRTSTANFEDDKQAIVNALHGQKMQVTLDSDPDYYYVGFVTVESVTFSGREKGTAVIAVDAEPFKYAKLATAYTQNGDGTVVCVNDRMEVIPQITNTAEATIVFGTVSVTLSEGVHKVAEIELAEGNNTLVITSTGLTTITYRQGRL